MLPGINSHAMVKKLTNSFYLNPYMLFLKRCVSPAAKISLVSSESYLKMGVFREQRDT